MKLKVCGMKYPDNIQNVAALEPDYMGFIFYEASARNFDSTIPKLQEAIKKVGVFVDADLDSVVKTINTHNLQAVQLHGHESPEYCNKLRLAIQDDCYAELVSASKPEIIKVFSIKDTFNFDELKPYESVCDYYLFDTKGKLPGGNGYTFNWDVLQNYPSTKPFFLSGGIGMNEIDKIKTFKQSAASKYCYALDVNSQFETAPGLKNIELIKAFKHEL